MPMRKVSLVRLPHYFYHQGQCQAAFRPLRDYGGLRLGHLERNHYFCRKYPSQSMKKYLVMALMMAIGCTAIAQQPVKLPAPNPLKASKMSLMEALQKRKSVREYSSKEISLQTLSTLLWTACGYNRPDEKRITAPSAINAQDITLYVCMKNGAYCYNPDENQLDFVSAEDLRPAVAGRQDFAKQAPVCIVLVSDLNKFRSPRAEFGAMDAGFVSENICLACTALGLATVPRASMEKETLTKAFGLNENQVLMLNNPVGWPK